MSTLDTVPTTEDLPASGRPKPKAQGGGFGRYLLVRFLLIFPTIFILVTLVFFLMRTTGDPITAAQGGRLGPEALAELRAAAGYDRPLFIQYFEYLGQLITGNFGSTLTTNRPVTEVLADVRSRHVRARLLLAHRRVRGRHPAWAAHGLLPGQAAGRRVPRARHLLVRGAGVLRRSDPEAHLLGLAGLASRRRTGGRPCRTADGGAPEQDRVSTRSTR